MRCGTAGLETTACPSAASVGARTAASRNALQSSSSSNSSAAATAPKPIVNGIPMPSRRAGTATFMRSRRKSILAASLKSTSTSVSSASSRTSSLSRLSSTMSRADGPTTRPKATKTIGPVTAERAKRREMTA